MKRFKSHNYFELVCLLPMDYSVSAATHRFVFIYLMLTFCASQVWQHGAYYESTGIPNTKGHLF